MSEQRPNDVEAFEEVYADVPGWPKVVGIFSIVWGSLGIVCGGCGTVFYAFMGNLLKMAEEQNGPAPEVLIPPVSVVASMGIGTLITVLLLVAGITTVQRTLAGRTLHLVYAPLSMINSVFGLVVGLQHQKLVAEWAAQNPGNPYLQGGAGATGDANTVIMVAVTIILVVYPVFCLVWFGLVKKTRASMTGIPEDAGRTP